MSAPRSTTRLTALLLTGVAGLAIATPAAAQSVWDGSADDDFGNAANWTPAGVPTPANQVIVDVPTNAPVIRGGNSFTVNSAIIGNNSTASLSVIAGSSLTLTSSAGLGIGGNQISGTNGNGTILIDGAGSQIITGRIDVAPSSGSRGLLTVSNGALFQSSNGFVGRGANAVGTVTVTGAGSRWLIDSGSGGVVFGDSANGGVGNLNVLAGGSVSYPGGVGWTLNAGSTFNVSGAGSSLTVPTALSSRGLITIDDGGTASFTSLQGSFGASLSVSGANSTFTTELLAMAQGSNATGGSLLVEAGGQLTSNGFSFAANGVPADFSATIQGTGSRWTINAGGSQNLGAGTNQVDFRVLDGAVVDSTASINNWSIGQGASVLVSGTGSRLLSGGVLNFNATTVGEPTGSFIVEQGGEVTVNANGLSALGSIGGPVSRSLIVRSGGQLNFTGGNGAGLSVRNGSILADGGIITGRLELAGEAARRTSVTVQNGGLIDGTGGGGWFADNEVDFLVTGANSRMIAVGAMQYGGDITVSAGGNASFEKINFGATDRVSTMLITGAGSVLTTRGLADAITGVPFAATRAGSADHAQITIANGGNLLTGASVLDAVDIAITGANSLWRIAADANSGSDLRVDASLSILAGGRMESLTGFNYSVGPATDVLISGAGSTMEIAANIGIQGGNPAGGTFVIENGGGLLTRGPSDNGLGFNGVQRDVVIRNGSSWIMTGGANSGLQIETTNLLVDGSTLSAQGIVSIGLRFSGTRLILRDSDFAARELNVGTVSGNQVIIGTRADGSAGAAGSFDVGRIGLNNGNLLVFNHIENALTVGATISGGAGSSGDPRIEHLAGTTIFTGGNGGFGGVFDISGGTVVINGSLGGNSARALVDSDNGPAFLRGDGTFGGDVTVADANFAPGNSAGIFTIGGDLVLGTNSELEFELGAPDLGPGNGSDLIVVGGDLTLDGTLNISNIGGFGSGLYRLITYGGTLTDNGLDFGTLPTNFAATGLTLDLATTGQVNLIAAADFDFIFWDGSANSANGLIDGGSGTWTVENTNWTTLDGDNNGVFDPADFLIFRAPEQNIQTVVRTTAAATPSSSTGTVTVDNTAGQVSLANGAQFAATGYTITGGAIRLDTAGNTIFRVGDGSSAGADFVATITSALTGPSGLAKTDLGTLILSGANSYTGGTLVEAGTLQGNSASLQGRFDIAQAGTLLFDQGSNGTFAGTIFGDGALLKQGAGTLVLSGDSAAYNGASRLELGGIDLSGSLGGQLTTLAGTRLSGGGQVESLDLSGTLAPGTAGAAGIFFVNGIAVFQAGSVLEVDLSANGGTDLVLVDDTATILGGTVAITLLDPETDYLNGTIFTILQADEGLTGTFDGLVETSAFLDFTLGYTADTAFLELSVIRQFPDVALTFNQRQASFGLAELDRTSGSDSLAVYNAILLLDADAARAAFDSASGEIYADILAAGNRGTAGRAFARQLAGIERGREGWDAWISGGIADGRVSDDGNGARFTQSTEQVELGLDYHGAGNRWAMGVSGGWLWNGMDNPSRSSDADLDGWFASAFARYGDYRQGLTLALAASHSESDGDVSRSIAIGPLSREATAAVSTQSTGVVADIRYGFGSGNFAFGPVAGIEHASTSLDPYVESGAGALSLSGAGGNDGWTRYGGGAFVSHSGEGFTALFDLRYLNGDAEDSAVMHQLAGSPRAFTVLPARGDQDALRASTSFDAELGERISLQLRGTALFAGEESDFSAHASLRIAF